MHINTITPTQCHCARVLLKWDQAELARRSGLHVQTICLFETEKSTPTKRTLERIIKTLKMGGVEFTNDEGVRRCNDIIHIIEGEDCYPQLLDLIAQTLKSGEEWLLSSCDDRRSPPIVIEKHRNMRKKGIISRHLIEYGNTEIHGAIEEYRWMPKGLFVDGDVKVIFADYIAYSVSWIKTPPRIILICDNFIAEEARRTFEYIWSHSQKPTNSTSKIFY